jgi:thiol:disulfide interchange protein
MGKKRLLPCLALSVMSLGAHQYSSAQQSTAPGWQQRLGGLFSNAKEDELLEPEQAFKLKVSVKGPATLMAELIPAHGYYLYKERLHFAIKDANGIAIKSIKLPPGEIKNDRTFGKMEIYKEPARAEISLERASSVKTLKLAASYQGCHEKTGVCYPPVDTVLNVALP